MKTPTASEILKTYHPITHDSELKTDLWPDSTVVSAMQEYARQVAEAVRDECFDLACHSDNPHNDIGAMNINDFIK